MIGKVLVLTLCVSQIYSQLILNELIYTVMECDFNQKFKSKINPEKVTITYYSAQIPKGVEYNVLEACEQILKNEDFSLNDKLNIYIGGFRTDSDTETAIMIKDAMLTINEPIMIVDYNPYCNIFTGYIESSLNIYNISEIITEFLIKLVKAGLPSENIYIMGHSLGAHLAGYIGRAFQTYYGRKLLRITGTDPAGPCFDEAGVEDTINENDAEYVDVYVFNRGQLGTAKAPGHAVFFVNGGGPTQPGCDSSTNFILIKGPLNLQCSHVRAMQEYWTKTILESGTATECENIPDAKEGNCDGDIVSAGYYSQPSTRGIYHVNHKYNVNKIFPW